MQKFHAAGDAMCNRVRELEKERDEFRVLCEQKESAISALERAVSEYKAENAKLKNKYITFATVQKALSSVETVNQTGSWIDYLKGSEFAARLAASFNSGTALSVEGVNDRITLLNVLGMYGFDERQADGPGRVIISWGSVQRWVKRNVLGQGGQA